MDIAAKLQVKPGQRIAILAETDVPAAHPKAGQLGTDLNRDILARSLTDRGVQPVRQVAIDEVWSALRLRPV